MREPQSKTVDPDGEKIRSIYISMDINIDQFAKLCGIAPRTMDKVIAGEPVNRATLKKIADKTKIAIEGLQKLKAPVNSTSVKIQKGSQEHGGYLFHVQIMTVENYTFHIKEGEHVPAEAKSILDRLGEILPNNEGLVVLSIGVGFIVFSCLASKANAASIEGLMLDNSPLKIGKITLSKCDSMDRVTGERLKIARILNTIVDLCVSETIHSARTFRKYEKLRQYLHYWKGQDYSLFGHYQGLGMCETRFLRWHRELIESLESLNQNINNLSWDEARSTFIEVKRRHSRIWALKRSLDVPATWGEWSCHQFFEMVSESMASILFLSEQ